MPKQTVFLRSEEFGKKIVIDGPVALATQSIDPDTVIQGVQLFVPDDPDDVKIYLKDLPVELMFIDLPDDSGE